VQIAVSPDCLICGLADAQSGTSLLYLSELAAPPSAPQGTKEGRGSSQGLPPFCAPDATVQIAVSTRCPKYDDHPLRDLLGAGSLERRRPQERLGGCWAEERRCSGASWSTTVPVTSPNAPAGRGFRELFSAAATIPHAPPLPPPSPPKSRGGGASDMSPGGGGENPLGALRLLSALCDSMERRHRHRSGGPRPDITAPPLDLSGLGTARVTRAVRFCEGLLVPKGKGARKRLRLRPWQRGSCEPCWHRGSGRRWWRSRGATGRAPWRPPSGCGRSSTSRRVPSPDRRRGERAAGVHRLQHGPAHGAARSRAIGAGAGVPVEALHAAPRCEPLPAARRCRCAPRSERDYDDRRRVRRDRRRPDVRPH
jgi:hypothetical protein